MTTQEEAAMLTLYTAGYRAGWTLHHLHALAKCGALVLDVRLNPQSRIPIWRRSALQSLLEGRYEWCGALGNVNYRTGGPIVLSDPAAGLEVLRQRLQQGPVVLLCGCPVAEECHRAVVAAVAQEAFPGLRVVHLAAGDPLLEVEAAECGEPASTPIRIKCLSLWQPWASLMAIGAKSIETRGAHADRWGLRKGDLVSIAATATWNREVCEWLAGAKSAREPDDRHKIHFALSDAGYSNLGELPLGAVLSVHRFGGCYETEALLYGYTDHTVSEQEEAFGDYSPGRRGLLLPRVLRLPEPCPAKGAQGVWGWDAPAEVAALLGDQYRRTP